MGQYATTTTVGHGHVRGRELRVPGRLDTGAHGPSIL